MTRSVGTTEEARRAHTNDVVDAALRHLVAHDMDAFANLFAPTGSIEFPIGASDFPSRIDGRDEVKAYLAHYTDVIDVRAIVSQTRHQSTDPAVVVVEFVSDCVAVASGVPFSMPYIAVVTVDEEGITSYRDYWSPLRAAEAIGATDLRETAAGTEA